MPCRPAWVEVGRVLRPHGLRGEVRVLNDSDNPERFAPGSILFARSSELGPEESARRELRVRSARPVRGALLVAFEGVEDRSQAEALRGYVLEVPGSALPELGDDEFYPFELEGLEVYDETGQRIGIVEELLDTPAQPVLVIRLDDSRTTLAPFTHEAVPEIDKVGGSLRVDSRFLT